MNRRNSIRRYYIAYRSFLILLMGVITVSSLAFAILFGIWNAQNEKTIRELEYRLRELEGYKEIKKAMDKHQEMRRRTMDYKGWQDSKGLK